MSRPGAKAAISLKENAKNLPDIYFRELAQRYSKDRSTRGLKKPRFLWMTFLQF